MEWQPIETAPKNGSILLVTDKEEMYLAGWWNWSFVFPTRGTDAWRVVGSDRGDGCEIINPTHWLPLPAIPKV